MNKVYILYIVLGTIVLYYAYDFFFNKRKKLVRVVLGDYNKYKINGVPLDETDSRLHEFLIPAWQSVGKPVSSSNISSWDNEVPWSAAAISYWMNRAGIPDFPSSAAHSVYIYAAKQKRLNNIGETKLELYRSKEFRPRVGDLICYSRQGSSVNYDTITDSASTHCDVVVKVERDHVVAVGGNVGHSIDVTNYYTDNGYVTGLVVGNKIGDNQRKLDLIGIIKNRHF